MIKVDYIIPDGKCDEVSGNVGGWNGFFLSTLRNDSDINLRCTNNISDIDIKNIIISNDINLAPLADFIEPSATKAPFERRDYIHTLMNKYGINNPKTINLDLSFRYTIEHIVKKLHDAKIALTNNKIVIRKQKTARSLGNLVISVDDIPNFINMLIDISTFSGTKDDIFIREIAEKNNIAIPSLDERGYWFKEDEITSLETYLASSRVFTVQEVIPTIVKEFRIYYHLGINTPADIKWVIDRTGFGLNTNKDNMNETLCWTDNAEYTYDVMYPLLEKAIKMFKDYKFLTASIDIAIDDKMNVWCLEFSTEYTLDGLTPTTTLQYIDDIKEGLIKYEELKEVK